jgi:long-chain fatty acid transport protein
MATEDLGTDSHFFVPLSIRTITSSRLLNRIQHKEVVMLNFERPLATTLALALTGASAFGLGYEKNIMWSGKYSGIGGVTAGNVDDATATLFNPAGLAAGDKMFDIQLNFSPTISTGTGTTAELIGPATGSFVGTSVGADQGFSPIFGGFVKFKPIDMLGIGLGVSAPGGVNATYTSDLSGPGNIASLTNQGDLSVIEFALGVGVEPLEGLRLGLGYRISMVDATLRSSATFVQTIPQINQVNFTDLSETRFNGFRAGIQYVDPKGMYGIGANWRSEVNFSLTGNVSGENDNFAAPAGTLTGGSAELRNTFPQQVNIGGFFAVLENKLKFFFQYDFTEYAKNVELEIDATLGGNPVSNIPQNWKNQHTIRVGVQYEVMENLEARIGYALATQVTPNERARLTFSAPGPGHSAVVGAGYGLEVAGNMLDLNLGVELSHNSGNGTYTDNGGSDFDGFFGNTGLAFHTGVGYSF